jgi:hypothetical protein
MSRHKPEQSKNNPSSQQKHSEGQEKSTNRHVYVEPGVQIDFVDDLKKKYQSNQGDNATHSNKILFWTKVSAGLLFIYAGLAWWQGCSARRSADAAIRATGDGERQIAVATEQFRQDQRAWIGVQSMALKIPDNPRNPIAAQAAMVNLGKTFALNVTSDFSLFFAMHEQDIAEHVKSKDRPAPNTTPSLGSLPPRESLNK